MADNIFANTVPVTQQADGITHHWGMRFTVGAASNCVGGRARIPSTGRPSVFFWQLWNEDTGLLLATVDLNTLSAPAPSTWMSFTSASFSPAGSVALVAGTRYIVDVFFQTGDGLFTNPGSFTIGNGVVPSVTNVTSSTGMFNNGLAQGVIPATTSATYFFADVEVDLAPTTVTGTMALNLPPLLLEADGDVVVSGTLGLTLPALETDEIGLVTVAGVLDLNIPSPQLDIDGALPVTGTLNITIKALDIDLDGNSGAGGNIMGPCGWNVPAPLCCDTWSTLDPAVQAAAQDYGATIMWAATGRRFGLCEVTVRPCGMKRCDDGMGEFFGWEWSGGVWMPYIFDGVWFNCACPGICCCEPRCQVRLVGPVDSIIEVTIGGIAVDPATYRVDDQHWLVRTAGECWPFCADLDSDDGSNVFAVTYLRGDPIPNSVLRASATLACEWGKACVGDGTCRLGNNVTSLARNGVTIDMTSPSELLTAGLTGVFEVDQIIRAWNPYGQKERRRIKAPELNYPRTVTSP